jgi:DNA ligase 1
MQLRSLVESLARLEGTRSRQQVVALVADLLRRAGPAEVEQVVYLLQGQLRPSYEGVETALGEKLIAAAIAEAYGVSESEVMRQVRATGDVGLVAAALAPRAPRRRLDVGRAYELLLEIAQASGASSRTRKLSLLAAALRQVGPDEAKFLARVTQGKLRLGVGEQTILEATALAALGDRAQKPLLESAYNVRSDLGGIVRLAFEKGVRGLANVGPKLGVPVRPALAQRLPSAQAIIERLGPVQAEPKYDGFRLQLHRDGQRVWAFSRRLENVTDMFPELVDAVRQQLGSQRAILEGEAVGYDPQHGRFLPFQLTMTRKRKTGIAEAAARYPLRLFAFDLLYAGRRNCLPDPQAERSRRLRELLPTEPNGAIAVTEAQMVTDADALQRYFDDEVKHGVEGIVAKRPDAPYRAGGRGYQWVKLKRTSQTELSDTVDLVVVGYFAGRGKRAALGIGSLLAAVYEPERDRFRTVAKIGSGATEREWIELRKLLDQSATPSRPPAVDSLITPDVWVAPKYVVEVLADEITRSPLHTSGKRGDQPGYALRFPRLVHGVRTDKSPTEATTEQEILELFRMQHK